MYATETQDEVAIRLDEQLAQDASGELRDRLMDELFLAAREIEATLASSSGPSDSQTLKDLLEAVRLSEAVVMDAWRAFHG
jgi:hypothetical protein